MVAINNLISLQTISRENREMGELFPCFIFNLDKTAGHIEISMLTVNSSGKEQLSWRSN
jgi:hypothetical protein